MALDTNNYKQGVQLVVTGVDLPPAGVTPPPPRPFWTLDYLASNAIQGSAQVTVQPDLGAVGVVGNPPAPYTSHLVGLFVFPNIISPDAFNQNHFKAACNAWLGSATATSTSPIPQLTTGMFCGYEVSIWTDQNDTDLQQAPLEHGHAFGATINVYAGRTTGNSHQGAFYSILDGALTILANPDGTPKGAHAYGINIDIANNVLDYSRIQTGVNIGSTGSKVSTYAIAVSGNWIAGIALNGHTIDKATTIGFSTPGVLNNNGTDTGYRIDGADTKFLKITGSGTGDDGSPGGVTIYGATGAGPNGLVRFRPYEAAGLVNNIVFNCGTGDAYFNNVVSCRSLYQF